MEKASDPLYESLSNLASRSDIHNRAIGSIIGAFLGDAMGSVLEFSSKVTDLQLKTAMKLSGGGVFELAPGQVTDDSELALSLAKSLIVEPFVLDLPSIAKSYREWYDSSPFDIGTTTSKAFKGTNITDKNGELNPVKCYIEMKKNVITHNKESLSNGALMRITPLAVFCHQMQNFEDIENAVQFENELTHSNPLVHKANALYVFAIQQLILNNGSYDKAKEKVSKLLEEIIVNRPKFKRKEWEIVCEWVEEAKGKDNLIPAQPNEGFIKIAFVYAFSAFFRKTPDFLSGIKEILARCGDTDTNACIYGGLIGAALGFKSLPEDLVTKLMNCKYYKQNRPEFLHPKSILQILPKLIKNSPLSLIYRGVQLEYPLSNENIFEKIMQNSNSNEKFNRIIGCLLGSLFGESQEKPKDLKGKKIKNFEESHELFKKLIRSLYHLSFEGNLTYFIDRFFELLSKKSNISHDYLIYAISLSICVFCSSNSFTFVKNIFGSEQISKTIGEDKEFLITFCFIIFHILNGEKRERTSEELSNFLEDKGDENKNFAIIRSLYQNYQLVSNKEKSIDIKSTLIMIFLYLHMEGGFILKKSMPKMKDDNYLKEHLFILGAIAGAYKGLKSFQDDYLKEILGRPTSPKYNSINIFYLVCKVMNLKI